MRNLLGVHETLSLKRIFHRFFSMEQVTVMGCQFETLKRKWSQEGEQVKRVWQPVKKRRLELEDKHKRQLEELKQQQDKELEQQETIDDALPSKCIPGSDLF